MMINRTLTILFILALVISAPRILLAGGPVHGAKAAAMGTAFDAVADDPSAILFNPAGLTQIKGSAAYFGVTALKPSTTYTAPLGASETTESQIFYPFHLYAASAMETENLVFGVGLYSPFGIGGRKWSTTGPTRYASTESTIATFSVNPTVAWRVSSRISVAAGADYMRSDMKMQKMIDQSALGAGDAETAIKADGAGWGYNAGVLLFPTEDLRIGLAYRSRITVKYSGTMTIDGLSPLLLGTSQFSSPVSSTSVFPDIYSLGIAYKPTERLVLDADVEVVRWSSFKHADLDIKQEAPPFITDSSTPLDWKDSWQYKLGLEYRMSERHFLRCGYAYIKNPVPEQTLEPGNPDADQHAFSIGTGYQHAPFWLDWFYSYNVYKKRSVQNNILSGEYESKAQYLGVSGGISF